ncbi:MAG: hypothetical protein IRY95_01800, partial [Clostridia bacterium]|nr:hypothetical protein [Clostridia bacterium]
SRSRSEPLRPLAAWYRWEAAGYLAGGLGLAAAAARPWGPGLLLQGEAIALGLAAAVVAVAVHDLPPLTVSPGRTAGADPPLVGAAIFCFAASALWETVALVFGIYWTEHLGGSVSGYGLIISSSTLAGIAAYWPLTAWGPRLGPNGLFRLAAAGYAGSFLSMSAAWAPAAAVAYAVPVSAALHAGAGLAAAEGTGAAARNRGMGVVEAAEALGACVGSLAGGLTADALGPVWVPRLAALAALGLLPLSAVAGQRRPPV